VRLLIISGLSGSGKSVALHALEDLDYYCIDNLPVALLAAFAGQLVNSRERYYENAAVGIDARSLRGDLEDFQSILEQLSDFGIECEILFLAADEDTLLKRFSETRRKHPLSCGDTPLIEAIRTERALLEPVAANADLVIDTTSTNVHELRSIIQERVHETGKEILSVLFESFAYKKGIPMDTDFIFDIRCLPNPHWVANLRPLTGLDHEVMDFLADQPAVARMFDDLKTFLEHWIPCFEAEHRSYVTVAIGCTGGRHRSVYMAKLLADHFRRSRKNVQVRHRDLQ